MNDSEGRITRLFSRKGSGKVLSIYFTAGFPAMEDTGEIIRELSEAGVDLIEVGVPFSDSLVDGPTIQMSNARALANGMTLPKLLDQVNEIRSETEVPLVLMSCLNPLLSYGIERLARDAKSAGIDGLIIPDLPVEIFASSYQSIFRGVDLPSAFLVTAHTKSDRVRLIDDLASAFIYVVSSDAVTGGALGEGSDRCGYFERLAAMRLKNPLLVGFGIHDRRTFDLACRHASGAVIGSAFIRALSLKRDLRSTIKSFVADVRN